MNITDNWGWIADILLRLGAASDPTDGCECLYWLGIVFKFV
jgi:hypothetical protein